MKNRELFLFKWKCVYCDDLVIIDIIPTLEGFGFLSGDVVECLTKKYITKCIDRYRVNLKKAEAAIVNYSTMSTFTKKDLLSSYF
jgi:hypothetical protein